MEQEEGQGLKNLKGRYRMFWSVLKLLWELPGVAHSWPLG